MLTLTCSSRRGCVFSSSEVAPSIQQVDQTFGATHPGIYDRERHLFLLNFRGLTFQFPVEPKFEVRAAPGARSDVSRIASHRRNSIRYCPRNGSGLDFIARYIISYPLSFSLNCFSFRCRGASRQLYGQNVTMIVSNWWCSGRHMTELSLLSSAPLLLESVQLC